MGYIASFNILAVNNKIIHLKIFLRDFCFVMKITSCSMGPGPRQFKFNNLFNEHLL